MTLIKENNISPVLSIIIPTLNESKNLPLLFSDLSEIYKDSEILIIDSISKDQTKDIALLYGMRFYKTNKKNRGFQLNYGAKKSKGEWLLFIHADSRLKVNWSKEIKSKLKKDPNFIYYFKFKVDNKFFTYRILEFFVNLRCLLFKCPYGDQGILINKKNFERYRGYKNIPLMEDFDFIRRVKQKKFLKALKTPIYTNSRKWEEVNFISQSLRNWRLRNLWIKGLPLNEIYEKYYENH
tara:strand:+ start:371 stop:1084 length:714 start_codon:yes stop_codon:yes gene_type:complete